MQQLWKAKHKIAIPQRMASGVILPQMLPTWSVEEGFLAALAEPQEPTFPTSLLLGLQVHATTPGVLLPSNSMQDFLSLEDSTYSDRKSAW